MRTVLRRSRTYNGGQTIIDRGYSGPFISQSGGGSVDARYIFGPNDGPMSAIAPLSGVGIYIDGNGNQFQYFNGAWH